MSMSLELQRMRTQKEKKKRNKYVEVCENSGILQSLQAWASEIRKRQHYVSEYLAKNIQGKQDVILHSYQNIQSFCILYEHPGSMRSHSY